MMIHLYYGDGKGKTTCAAGLAVRAAGEGWKVIFVQFLKNGKAGEIASLKKLGVTVLRGKAGSAFVKNMTDSEKRETKRISNENLSKALSMCSGEEKVLLVLDEVCAAFEYNLIDKVEVECLVCNLPENIELVLTGRNPPSFMIEKARYITHLRKERHPFDSGVPARCGIEY